MIIVFAALTAQASDVDIAGGCPGKTLISGSGLSASSNVRVLSGSGVGGDVISTDGCVVTTGLAGPVARALATSDVFGNLQMGPRLGAGACGMYIQLLDVATCTLSDAESVPLAGQSEGPDFSAEGWTQCQGYYDTKTDGEIPKVWGGACEGVADNQVRVACGANTGSYRYIDVNKNPFRDGLVSYPEHGIIYNSNFALTNNDIYATGNDPHVAQSWWQTGDGCGESNLNLTVNNICTWEASNCFGQGLTGDRYLWIYVKP